MKLQLADERATDAFGQAMASAIDGPLDFHLDGDLGTGKTALVRAVLRGLGHSGAVPSPTYTLVETYAAGGHEVQHLDLYRLADAEELEFIGGRDYFAVPALRFIEWPARAAGFLAAPDVVVKLAARGTGRSLELRPVSAAGGRFVARIRWKAECITD